MTDSITIERLNAAIAMTAYAMALHKLPQLLPTLKRLEAARDDLALNGDALEYAKRVLERVTIEARPSLSIPAQEFGTGSG